MSQPPLQSAQNSSFPKMLRIKQVIELTGLSRTTIYALMNPSSSRHDPTFPQRVPLTRATVGWIASEIAAWLESRIAQSRQQ